METTTINLSWLCLVFGFIIYVVIAVLGIRARLRYARRLRDALARGAFADMNSPKVRARLQRLTVVSLIGVLGTILSIVVLILQQASNFRAYSGITFIVAGIFAVTGIIAGVLRQREYDRRL